MTCFTSFFFAFAGVIFPSALFHYLFSRDLATGGSESYSDFSIHSIESFELSNEERDAFFSACPGEIMPGLGVGNGTDFVIRSHRLLQDKAPKRLLAFLKKWKANPNLFNAVLIDNILTQVGLEETPTDGKRTSRNHSSCNELLITGIAAMIGDPFAFAAEKPWLVNDLAPIRGMEASVTNAGSRAQLPWHTEHAATGLALNLSSILVSEIVLGVLRPSPNGNGDTLVADARDAEALLSPSDKNILQGPNYYLRPPPSMRASLKLGHCVKFGPRPILFDAEFEFRSVGGLYHEGVEPISNRARIALDNLRRALDEVQQKISSRQGRVIVLNNRMTFHARSQFIPVYDGSDRWLQRVLVSQRLKSLVPWLQHSSHIVNFD